MSQRTARLLLGVVLPVAILALWFLPYIAFRSDLPGRVATHFNVSGTADGSMTPNQLLLVTGAFLVVGLGLCVLIATRGQKFSTFLLRSSERSWQV